MIRFAAAAVLLAAAAPAAAVNMLAFNFGGSAANLNSVAVSNSGVTLTATSRKFTVAPGLLTSLSQTTAVGQIRRTGPGIGVLGGASADQLDTNQVGTTLAPLREAILITSSREFGLTGLRLSFVDVNDTLKVYGVRSTGALVDLGYATGAGTASTIAGGLNGAATGLTYNAGVNNGTATFGVVTTAAFDRFLFTTRVGGDVIFNGDGGQGYRLDNIFTNLPEPGTWALLIIGFGFVGIAARRRNAGVPG